MSVTEIEEITELRREQRRLQNDIRQVREGYSRRAGSARWQQEQARAFADQDCADRIVRLQEIQDTLTLVNTARKAQARNGM